MMKHHAKWVNATGHTSNVRNRLALRGLNRRRTLAVLEQLEERTLLATFSWFPDASGDWSDPSNWRDGKGNSGVPGFGDTAIISQPVTVSITGSAAAACVISNASLEITAGSSLALGADSNLLGVGQSSIVGTLSLAPQSELAVVCSLSALGPVMLDDAQVQALGGGHVELTGLTQATGGVSFEAEGAGSVLNAPGLASVAGSTDGTWSIGFNAWVGGDVELPALTQATGDVSFDAEGAGSVLNAPGLASVAGSTGGAWSSEFTAGVGGDVELPALAQATGGVEFYASGAATVLEASALTDVAGNIRFDAEGGGDVELPKLAQATGSLGFMASDAGSVLDAPVLTTVAESTDIQGTISFDAQSGGDIELPKLAQATGGVSFYASGAATVLEASALTDVAGNIRFDAEGSGDVELPQLAQATGLVISLASGTGSLLDFSDLASIAGPMQAPWSPNSFQATWGGDIELPQLAQATGEVDFWAQEAGSIPECAGPVYRRRERGERPWRGGHRRCLLPSQLRRRHRAPGPRSLHRADGFLGLLCRQRPGCAGSDRRRRREHGWYWSVSFDAGGGGDIELANLAQVTGTVLFEVATGSSLSLPNLTTVAGGSFFAEGGDIELPALTQVTSVAYYSADFSASGIGSLLDAPALTAVAGSGYGSEISVLGGGTIRVGTDATSTAVSDIVIDVGSGSNLDTAALLLGEGATLEGTGSVAGNVDNASTVSLGSYVWSGFMPVFIFGALTIEGNYVQEASGQLQVFLETPSDSSQLIVTGTAALDGTLGVSFISGFAASQGDSFQVLTFESRTGDFSDWSGMQLPNGDHLHPDYDDQSLNLADGFVVTNGDDSGPGSFRDVLDSVNEDPIALGPDNIVFADNIPDDTISPLSPLPELTRDQVTIIGPVILDGSLANGGGLSISGDQDAVQDVTIQSFNGAGITITGDDDSVTGCAITENFDGIDIIGGSDNSIGGVTDQAQNLIAINSNYGILLNNAQQTAIQGNLVGTDAVGDTGLGNSTGGIFVENSSCGNVIGGTVAGEANVIAFNGGNGVTVGADATDASPANSILGNSIYANSGLGIDLGNDGVTQNDFERALRAQPLRGFPGLDVRVHRQCGDARR